MSGFALKNAKEAIKKIAAAKDNHIAEEEAQEPINEEEAPESPSEYTEAEIADEEAAADEQEKEAEVNLDDAPSDVRPVSTSAQDVFVLETDWEPPQVVVRCAVRDCTHNYRGYCGGMNGEIEIDYEPDMGKDSRATECAYYDPIKPHTASEEPNE